MKMVNGIWVNDRGDSMTKKQVMQWLGWWDPPKDKRNLATLDEVKDRARGSIAQQIKEAEK